ncbi:hypothetical protein RTP6_002407 [Batrachochytrium dendrobatidis]
METDTGMNLVGSNNHYPVQLTPARVAIHLYGDHRGISVTNTDNSHYLMLTDPFASNSSKKYYIDYCFKGSTVTPDTICHGVDLDGLVKRILHGGCSAIVTAKIGRSTPVSRTAIHVEAIQRLFNSLNSIKKLGNSVKDFKITMAFIGFTDTKCMDMFHESTIKSENLKIDDHYHSVDSTEALGRVKKGCSLPFIISIKLDLLCYSGKFIGQLILADLGTPSYRDLPDRSSLTIPYNISTIRDLTSMLVTPGAAGELPFNKSIFTQLASELFGGSATSLYILTADVADSSCVPSDVQPCLEFYDLMRKLRNTTSVNKVSGDVLELEARILALESKASFFGQCLVDLAQVSSNDMMVLKAKMDESDQAVDDIMLDMAEHILCEKNAAKTLALQLHAAHTTHDVDMMAEKEHVRRETIQKVNFRHTMENIERVLVGTEETNLALEEKLTGAENKMKELNKDTAKLHKQLLTSSQKLQLVEVDYADIQRQSQIYIDNNAKLMTDIEQTRSQLEAKLVFAKELEEKYAKEKTRLEEIVTESKESHEKLLQKCQDLEHELLCLNQKHQLSITDAERIQSELLIKHNETTKTLDKEREDWMAERNQLCLDVKELKESKAQVEKRLQESTQAVEIMAKQSAKAPEKEIHSMAIEVALKENLDFIKDTFARERLELQEQTKTLMALAATQETTLATTKKQAADKINPTAKKTASKPIVKSVKPKNNSSKTSAKQKDSSRTKEYDETLDTSIDSIPERNDEGSASFIVSEDGDAIKEISPIPKRPRRKTRQPLSELSEAKQPSLALEKPLAEHPKRKAKSIEKPDVAEKTGLNLDGADKKRKINTDTTKPSFVPEDNGEYILKQTDQPSASLSGFLSFLSGSKEKEPSCDALSNTTSVPLLSTVAPKLPKHVIDQRRLAILRSKPAE